MQPIIQHLFQASSLEDVSRQRLESFVAEYPSFGIGHYLLSRKLLAEGSDNYMEETQRTNLYFTNPFWLQWLLENSEAPAFAAEGGTAAATVTGDPTGTASETEYTSPAGEAGTAVAEAGTAVAEGGTAVAESSSALPAEAAAAAEPAPESTSSPAEDQEPAALVSIASSVAAETHDAGEPESMVALAEQLTATPEPAAAELLLQSIQEAKGLRESLQKINDDFAADPAPSGGPEQPAPQDGPIQEALPVEQPIKDEEPPFVLEEEPVKEGPGPGLAAEAPVVEEVQPPAVETVPSAEPAESVKPSAPTEQTYIFEPYHTIDYFASQGIKLHLEENPSDQLGKQLKSFTEWLKTMRRLPQKEREVMPDQVAEATIQTIAAHSVVGREVVTETMAEVLAKQGMPERARALYEKLSLLNPDKKAYFATKIEQLNSH